MAEYQHVRQARARAERAEAERNGTAETFVPCCARNRWRSR